VINGLNGTGQLLEVEEAQPIEKSGVLVRVPQNKLEQFKELYPWHGGLTQFWLQCLDEFLKLSEGNKTPAQLTTEAVSNVFRNGY
jgi:hypothetical protein